MHAITESMLNEFRAIANKVIPSGGHAWLYGSRARGDENLDSDWDLLILIDKDRIQSTDEDEISYPFVMLGWQKATSVSPLLYTFKEWEQRSASPFWTNVERDKIQIL